MSNLLKRCCLAFVFLLAANLNALEVKNGELPEFNGVPAVVLKKSGSVIHPSHLIVRLKNNNDLEELKNLIAGESIDFKKEFDILYKYTVGVNYGRR